MDERMKPKILVIVGQTGSGKTSLSIELAKKFDGEVVSADSRQVYKGLDIGTEKIAEGEMEDVPHHLLSIVPPEHIYTAQEFVEDADRSIADISSREKLPIIAGGTFFYIDMLLRKISSVPVPPNYALREGLGAHDEPKLHAMLQNADPVRAATIDPHNKRRLVRALEIVHVLPAVPQAAQRNCPYAALIIGLQVDKKVLRERLRARAERALQRGLVEETERLLASGVTRERLSEIGLEYRLVLTYLDGALTKSELVQKFEEKNWQYAKRQQVWLKRDQQIQWFAREDTEAIARAVQAFLSN